MFRFVATTGTGFILQSSTISCSLCTAYNTMHWNILPGVTTVHRQLGMLGRFAGMQCTVNLSATEKKISLRKCTQFRRMSGMEVLEWNP